MADAAEAAALELRACLDRRGLGVLVAQCDRQEQKSASRPLRHCGGVRHRCACRYGVFAAGLPPQAAL